MYILKFHFGQSGRNFRNCGFHAKNNIRVLLSLQNLVHAFYLVSGKHRNILTVFYYIRPKHSKRLLLRLVKHSKRLLLYSAKKSKQLIACFFCY